MKLEDLIGLLIISTWLGLLTLEAIFPARSYPRVTGWRWLGALGLLAILAIGTFVPLALPAVVFEHTLFDLSGLPIPLGVAIGFAGVTFVGYFYHRACHRYDGMWRWLHQLHHSAPRLDLGGAFLFHPFEGVAYALIQTVVLVPVLGLSAEAAAIAGFVGAFYSIFQHLNMRTPSWLGYLIQRPESHSLHHAFGVHAYNYGDLPVWDLLFGTFKNQATHQAHVGFGSDQHTRVFSMLLGRDVSRGSGTQALQGTARAMNNAQAAE